MAKGKQIPMRGVRVTEEMAAGNSYIDSWNPTYGSGGFFYTKPTGSNIWHPALAFNTKGGGGWAVGNYDSENLVVVYGNATNIANRTNSVTHTYLYPLENSYFLLGVPDATGYTQIWNAQGNATNYIKAPANGIIPTAANTTSGSGYLGTSTWPWIEMNAKHVYCYKTATATTTRVDLNEAIVGIVKYNNYGITFRKASGQTIRVMFESTTNVANVLQNAGAW